jgi:uncharacterized membrane protein HdeD (DUF308 family)
VTGDEPRVSRWWLTVYLLARALAATVLGILLLVRPDDTVVTLARITGILLLVIGGVDLTASLVRAAMAPIRVAVLLRGALTVGVGVVLLALTDATVTVVAIVLGMQLVVGGGVSMVLAYRLRSRVADWRAIALRGLLTLAVGTLALVWPSKSVATLAVLFGVQWILSGIVSTAVAVRMATRA